MTGFRAATPHRLAVVALALVAGLALPTSAGAHAVLVGSEPARGAQLERVPEQVSLRFDEPVEASFGAVRVFDRAGDRVDTGELLRPGGGSDELAVALEPELPDGVYTATFRVLSADSHPVAGGFAFTVGDPPLDGGPGVQELIEQAGTGPATDVALGAARVLTYAAIAGVVGAVVFLLVCWAPVRRRLGEPLGARATEALMRRLRPLLAVALGIGIAVAAAGIVLQGAVGLGGSAWDALDVSVIGEVIETRFGTVWAIRLAVFAAIGTLLLAPRIGLLAGHARNAPVITGALVILLAGLIATPGLAGHPAVTDPRWLSLVANFVHVGAFSVWMGGVLALLLVLPAATRSVGEAERTTTLATVLARFSALALGAVATLLATGVVQALLALESWSDLIDTGYGRAIVVKAGLLVLLVTLGALNRRRSVPAIRRLASAGRPPGPEGLLLRRSLRAEVALIGAVLVATAFLAATAPSKQAADGPYAASAELGPAALDLTVDPAAAGSNEIHLYLFDGETGAQYDRPREVRVNATLAAEDVGPLRQRVAKAGPGHYVVRDAQLGIAGEWTLGVEARVSAFDQYTAEVQVPVR